MTQRIYFFTPRAFLPVPGHPAGGVYAIQGAYYDTDNPLVVDHAKRNMQLPVSGGRVVEAVQSLAEPEPVLAAVAPGGPPPPYADELKWLDNISMWQCPRCDWQTRDPAAYEAHRAGHGREVTNDGKQPANAGRKSR